MQGGPAVDSSAGGCPWGAFARADYTGCEPDLCAWIVHPAETWSNLAYVWVAAVLLLRYGAADRDLFVARFPLIILAIGIFSAVFHASMSYWLQAADLAAIFLLTGHLLAANLHLAGMLPRKWFAGLFFALAAGGIVLALVDARLGYFGIAVQGVAILWTYWRIPARGRRMDLVAAIGLNQAAAIGLWLDHAQVACVRGGAAHIVQPHSFWHALSALCLFYFYRYQREIERELRKDTFEPREPVWPNARDLEASIGDP